MKIIKKIAHKFLTLNRIICYWFFRTFCPVKNNKIYFISNFGNMYACNPRAYFEYLYENHKNEFEFYYCMNNDNLKNLLPNGVETAKYKTIKDYYHLATSKYIVNNFRFHKFFRKRKNQIYVQTWHGIPLKMIEKDAELSASYKFMAKNDSKYIDILPVASTHCYDVFNKSFFYNSKCDLIGSPRYDCLSDNKKNKEQIFSRFGLSGNEYIILYAPTFRNNRDIKESFLNNEKIVTEFSKITNKKIKILYRFHPNIENETKKYEFENYVINVTSYFDIQDLLIISDILITDFSSCMFDMMIAKKPCIIYTNNLEQYLKNERKTYFSIEKLPYPVANSEGELYNIIRNYKMEFADYIEKIKQFNEQLGILSDGCANERLYELMMKKVRNK